MLFACAFTLREVLLCCCCEGVTVRREGFPAMMESGAKRLLLFISVMISVHLQYYKTSQNRKITLPAR